MSVALRGSARGTLGTLRRTASLEYFLDCDKECDVEEVELATPPPRPLATSAQYAKVRREQMDMYPTTKNISNLFTSKYLALRGCPYITSAAITRQGHSECLQTLT